MSLIVVRVLKQLNTNNNESQIIEIYHNDKVKFIGMRYLFLNPYHYLIINPKIYEVGVTRYCFVHTTLFNTILEMCLS